MIGREARWRDGTESADAFAERGFSILREVLPTQEVVAWREVIDRLDEAASSGGGLLRNVLHDVEARTLAVSEPLEMILSQIGFADAFPVRGLIFDKRNEPGERGNWGVGWHQDTVIAVERRVQAPSGFGAWSRKAGVEHVVAPAEVLASMVTLRLAIDAADHDRGPLQVISGSHRDGVLDSSEIHARAATAGPRVCSTAVGDVIAMCPLLLHASAKATHPGRRRVVHLEYANRALPGGLNWADPTSALILNRGRLG